MTKALWVQNFVSLEVASQVHNHTVLQF